MDYAGDISPEQCWQMLSESGQQTIVVDVRTSAEWAFVGMPELADTMTPLVRQEWQRFPAMDVNPDFADALDERLKAAGADPSIRICFLCRSGARSLAAAKAMHAKGYASSYNIVGGFEGDPNADGHRGRINGWKAAGLPWRQG